MSESAILVEDVVQDFGSVRALDAVSLTAQKGEVLGLLGPNGAGKSTLLEICVGLQRPRAGRVRVLGLDPADRPLSLRRRVSVQPQQAALMPELTVLETLQLWASFYDTAVPPEQVIEVLGMREVVDQRAGRLSGGQLQRLRIGLALVPDPEVVFLDEPSAGLDPGNRRALRDAISALRDGARAIVLSTHHMDEAEQLCDSVVVLDHGAVVERGRPAEIVARRAPGRRVRFQVDELQLIEGVVRHPGVLGAHHERGPSGVQVWLDVDDAAAADVIRHVLDAPAVDARDVAVERGSLEEAFLAVTGTRIDPAGERTFVESVVPEPVWKVSS